MSITPPYSKAYPRVCGATDQVFHSGDSGAGLSPRVRGNLGKREEMITAIGPIPACAGQPTTASTVARSARAYPRVCGATADRYYATALHEGLSPRVRGNLYVARANVVRFGPIPACAGQPSASLIRTSLSRAYPRVCGATDEGQRLLHDLQGLSPRVRGNQLRHCPAPSVNGPIPACAGQPWVNWDSMLGLGAYPRVCGATKEILCSQRLVMGLSPRVRGNRPWKSSRTRRAGPIPACAGQPERICRFALAGWAYPRVCGATLRNFRRLRLRSGLSPRVRGNRTRQQEKN